MASCSAVKSCEDSETEGLENGTFLETKSQNPEPQIMTCKGSWTGLCPPPSQTDGLYLSIVLSTLLLRRDRAEGTSHRLCAVPFLPGLLRAVVIRCWFPRLC